jgi:thiol-disulfide isomerase/thioredoxin
VNPVRTFALLAVLFAPVPLLAQDGEVIGIRVGSSLPDSIPVEDLDGRVVNLADYIGTRPAVVEFWATWCPLCEALLPQLEATRRRHGDSVEVLIVAVAVNQSKNSVRRHLARHPMPGRVFYDAKGAATRAFEAPSTSYIVTVGRDGKVAYTGLGDRQRIDVAVERAVRRAVE